MQQLSTIGRPLDFRYKTNKVISFLTVGEFLVALGDSYVAHGVPFITALSWAAQFAIGVFLSWALCRELDPDHDASAFVAAAVAVAAILTFGLPSLGLLFWMLLASRIVNRTTGVPATILDSLITLALAAWLTRQFGVAILYLTAGNFFLDAWIGPKGRRQFAMAAVAIASAIIATLLHWPGYYGEQYPNACLIALAFTIVFTPVFIGASKVKSKDDKTIALLHPLRIQSAQVMALLGGILLALLLGQPGLRALSPLWAASIGAPIFWIFANLKPSK